MNKFLESKRNGQQRIFILIDDLRALGEESSYDFVFRDSQSALDYFDAHTDVSDVYLYIDNDLGEGQMEGRKILDIILERDVLHCPNDVYIVSSNPVGVAYMQAALRDKKYLVVQRTAMLQS